jgi:hypothetical protein
MGYQSTLINGKVRIVDSAGEFVESDNLNEVLDFLLETYVDRPKKGEEPKELKVCWELNDFTSVILRLMGAVRPAAAS